jgi:hypothetical protein
LSLASGAQPTTLDRSYVSKMITKFMSALYRKLFGVPEYYRVTPARGKIFTSHALHFCGTCGAKLIEIRPGKYQCKNCE